MITEVDAHYLYFAVETRKTRLFNLPNIALSNSTTGGAWLALPESLARQGQTQPGTAAEPKIRHPRDKRDGVECVRLRRQYLVSLNHELLVDEAQRLRRQAAKPRRQQKEPQSRLSTAAFQSSPLSWPRRRLSSVVWQQTEENILLLIAH